MNSPRRKEVMRQGRGTPGEKGDAGMEGGKHVREGGIVFDSEPICIPVLKSFLFFSFFSFLNINSRNSL